MRLKTLLFALILLITSSGLFADGINQAAAEKVAVNFYYEKSNLFDKEIAFHELEIVEARMVEDAFYIINLENGWVIVSANDAMTPVIGYNFTGQYPAPDQLNDNLKSWMFYFIDQVNFIEENNITADQFISADWEKYLSDEPLAVFESGCPHRP